MTFGDKFHVLRCLTMAAGLGAFLALAGGCQRVGNAQAGATDSGDKPKKRVDKAGEITLNADLAEGGLFLEVEPAKAESDWSEPVTVYGQVVPNPLATVEVRAPFGGVLREGSKPWPKPGQPLQVGDELGWVDIRVSPQDRLDLQNKLNEATLKHKGAVETLKVKQAQVRRLESASQSVPLRELEAVRVQLSEARTQEDLAKSALELWREALSEIDRPGQRRSSAWSYPLKAPAAGEVAELAGRPGTSVEPGALLIKLVDFRRPLVRLDLPPDTLRTGPPKTVDLWTVTPTPGALRGVRNQPRGGAEALKIQAALLGAASGVTVGSQYAGYFYEVETSPAKNGSASQPAISGSIADSIVWRPGLAVKAEVRLSSPDARTQNAVSVPVTALLYHQGRALIYVRINKDGKTVTFARREVQVLGRKDNRCILAATQELDDKAAVVVRNAQRLLSEEFNRAGDDDD